MSVKEYRTVGIADDVVLRLFVFFVHVWIRGWEGWIKVLGDGFVFLELPLAESVEIGLFHWAIFVEGTADEVGAVRELGCA